MKSPNPKSNCRTLAAVCVAALALAACSRCSEVDSAGASAAVGLPGAVTATDGSGPGLPVCVAWEPAKAAGLLVSDQLAELSGLAVSRRHAGVLWTHNDAGNKARVYAIGGNGVHVATLKLKGTDARDWEDIALGPCTAGGDRAADACLYLADTGDNDLRHSVASILRFHEPKWVAPRRADEPGRDDVASAAIERFSLAWPGAPRDVEAMAVLPDTRVILLSKRDDGRSEVLRVTLKPGTLGGVEVLGELDLRAPPLLKGGPVRVTAADLDDAGQLLLVRTYGLVALFEVGDALTSAPDVATGLLAAVKRTILAAATEAQGEAIAWDPSGGFWQASERSGKQPATLWRVGCAP